MDAARRVAVTVIAATEGAIALCRAQQSREPFEDVTSVLLSLPENTHNPADQRGGHRGAVKP